MTPHHPHSKLQHVAQEQLVSPQLLEEQQQQQTLEFATAEEMIRYDAANVAVPPAVTERLRKSVNAEAPAARSWWQRWLD
jgi:hypothetical protein